MASYFLLRRINKKKVVYYAQKMVGTVLLHMVADVQKRGGIAAFIDAKHALDPKYAKNIGVNIDELYISQPDSGNDK